MTTILTPLEFSGTETLERRLFRKRVLPIDSINYEGRKIDFTRQYLADIVTSFNDGAFDNVPLQFADANNSHTNAPERYRGDVVAMSLEDDGLYVTVSATPEGAKVLKENNKLGISARIINSYERSDGKSYNAAVQHVLATHDPRIPGLGPWSTVESYSNEDNSDTIDLTTEKFGVKDGNTKTEKGKSVPDKDKDNTLSVDELAKLRALLADLDADEADEDADTDVDNGGEQLTDKELEDLLNALDVKTDDALNDNPGSDADAGKVPAAAGAGADLSSQHNEALELANAHAVELARIQGELDETKWSKERDLFIKEYGFTPKIMDMAKPVLKGKSQVIDLANGEKTDSGTVMREVLTEVGKLVKLLDLSNELGSGVDETPDRSTDAASRRDEVTKAVRGMMGN